MKTKLSYLAFGIILLHSSWIAPAASEKLFSGLLVKKEKLANPEFNFFRTHRQGRGITATWGLTMNHGVSGFVVQRTYEDPNDPYSNWENVGAIPCGSERSYRYQDLNVSPGFISYRVIAYLQQGGSMMSETSTIRIVSH
jgi:hypothetical protein